MSNHPFWSDGGTKERVAKGDVMTEAMVDVETGKVRQVRQRVKFPTKLHWYWSRDVITESQLDAGLKLARLHWKAAPKTQGPRSIYDGLIPDSGRGSVSLVTDKTEQDYQLELTAAYGVLSAPELIVTRAVCCYDEHAHGVSRRDKEHSIRQLCAGLSALRTHFGMGER